MATPPRALGNGGKMYFYRKGNKYKNKKVVVNGIEYDSRAEAIRGQELEALQAAGEICDLRRQVPFELLPTQREAPTRGKRGGIIKGKVIEKAVTYIADFCYTDKDGHTIVEDVKGLRTKEYIIKRKMMLFFHGIRVQEITTRGKRNG